MYVHINNKCIDYMYIYNQPYDEWEVQDWPMGKSGPMLTYLTSGYSTSQKKNDASSSMGYIPGSKSQPGFFSGISMVKYSTVNNIAVLLELW
jgi:hypothetical protein